MPSTRRVPRSGGKPRFLHRQPELQREGTAYTPLRPTKLDKIKNLHSTDTIDTENSDTRGRPIWVHSSQVGKADSKWVCYVVPAYPNV